MFKSVSPVIFLACGFADVNTRPGRNVYITHIFTSDMTFIFHNFNQMPNIFFIHITFWYTYFYNWNLRFVYFNQSDAHT